MNHTIKDIIRVVAISSMLIVGATSMIPIIQNSFASQDNTTIFPPPIDPPPFPPNNPPPATGTGTLLLSIECISQCNPGTTFPITVTGNNPQPSSFILAGEQPVKIGSGSFAVSADTNVPHSFSGDCKGAISAGQTIGCFIIYYNAPP